MRILITTGPTREYIDTVRFISNASSGWMGWAVSKAAMEAGHEVTILAGPGCGKGSAPATKEIANISTDGLLNVISFVSVADLHTAVEKNFDACDALVMAAAVGDFRPAHKLDSKLSRSGGAITLELTPTEDILAAVGARKEAEQIIVAFSVEDLPEHQAEKKARDEMATKRADYCVVNTPDAMSAEKSYASILSHDSVVASWAWRTKDDLAGLIVELLNK